MSRLTSAATKFFANFASFVRQQFFASRQNPLPFRHAAVERIFLDGGGAGHFRRRHLAWLHCPALDEIGVRACTWKTPRRWFEQVQTLSDLVTVKYVLEKVVILEDAKWYGENRVLLLAHGIVKAGIDLKRITPDDVTISGKTICLRPAAAANHGRLSGR